MSSARKRAAIQKANNEAEFLRQRLMRAEHYANVMQGFAEGATRRLLMMPNTYVTGLVPEGD
jgi:hypothetical protein